MPQDNLAKLECTACKRTNYYSHRNKKTLSKIKLVLNKFCQWCGKHTPHKETK